MNIGDSVAWRANATHHEGQIVAVIPPRRALKQMTVRELVNCTQGRRLNSAAFRFMLSKGTGSTPREHRSYLVKSGDQYYWPRVKGLERAS